MNRANHTDKNGMLEEWNVGRMDEWNIGSLEYWIEGQKDWWDARCMSEIHPSNIPAFHASKLPSVHFIGIGGCGMNGVAQLAAHAGYAVFGSDRAADIIDPIVGQASLYSESLCPSPDPDNTRSRIREARPTQPTGLEIFHCLEKQGIRIVPQDGSGITEATDFVVYSTAIEDDNPDILKAKALNTPLLHRAEMLAKLCEGKQVIAIAGTAGKSTVTGLLGWIFQNLPALNDTNGGVERGMDPTVYCGAPVLNWIKRDEDVASTLGNVRFGSGPWIIEADESDKSFLHFHPDHAIITNIAEDHFELSELKKLFAQFESQVSGVVIKPAPPRRSGTPPRRGFVSGQDSPSSEGWPKAGVGSLLIGKHNTENINNALKLCQALGLDMGKCIEAVATFKGIERRLERIDDKVIDDFAHSPIKIAAALEAVSGEFKTFNVVWRPHGFSPLFQGLEGFIDVFSNQWKKAEPSAFKFSNHWKQNGTRPLDAFGKLFILPVYYAGGTVEKKITSEQFVERLQAAGVPAEFVESFQTLQTNLLADPLPVLIMGARDPELPIFARRLADQL